MSEFNTYEYVVGVKKGASVTLKKLGMLALYFVFVVLWFVFGFATKFYPLLALIPITLWILIFLTWRYVNVEYEYSFVSGEMTVSKIFGARTRKKILNIRIKNCTLIAPLSENKEKVKAFAPVKTTYALSCADSPEAYVALYECDGTRGALYFDANEKALKMFRFYNAPATVIKK